MAGKRGTLLGRTLGRLLGEDNPLHAIAEDVDATIETVVFDGDKDLDVVVSELTDTEVAKEKLADLLQALVSNGIARLDFPGLEGDNEKDAQKGAALLINAYINDAAEDLF